MIKDDYGKVNRKKIDRSSFRIIKTYDYRDQENRIRTQTVRAKDKNNPKIFYQRQLKKGITAPDSKNPNHWINNLKDVSVIPYRLPELLASKELVVGMEGEKDVDALRQWNFTVTCNPMGAMKWKRFEKELNPYLKNRDFMFIPDNDLLGIERDKIEAKHLVGEKHLAQVAESLKDTVKSFKVLRLPGVNDFSDWQETKGNSEEKFLMLMSEAPDWKDIRKETISNIKKLEKEIKERKDKEQTSKANTNLESQDPKKKSLKTIDLEELLDTFKKWLELEETEYIEVILATILSNQLLGDPVWLFVIGASGASKTEVLRSFQNMASIYTTSKLTAQSLVSGKVFKDSSFDPSLLPHLDGKTLILKDFTTILSMRAEDKQIIFSDLREAYDGYLEKNFGNIGKKRFNAHFTIIAGVTPVLDKFTAMQQQLGERFLKIRLSQKETKTKIERAVNNLEVQTAMREELNTATQRFFAQRLKLKETLKQVKIAKEIKDMIIKLAQYIASLRTSVSRNPYNREVLDYIPEDEVGTRLGIQLAKLGKALAAIRNKKEITESELRILTRIAKDTIPKKVRILMDCLTKEPYGLKTSEFKEKTGIENRTCLYALYDLQVLGLVISKELKGKGAKGSPLNWTITEKFEKLITAL